MTETQPPSGGTNEERIHRATSDDGTEIAGHVHGDGPPLVFFHGGLTDGDHAWSGLLPSVTEHFTCYLPNMRGTGLSEDSDDQRPERHMEDLAAFIDSIGEPVGLVGHSTGGTYGFGAVQRGASVSAMAAYEPAVFEFWEEGEDAERYHEGVVSMGEAANEGRLEDAARAILSAFASDEELAVMEDHGHFEYISQYIPTAMQVFEQALETEAPNPNDPSELSQVTVPVFLVYGSESTTAHIDSMYYLDEQLPNTELCELPGVGHMAPELGSEAVADAFIEFFDEELATGAH